MRLILFIIFISFASTIAAQVQGHLTTLKRRNMEGAEWTTFRGNNNRDGRVVSTGQFENNARLSASIDYSTSEAYIELIPAATNSRIRYASGESIDTVGLNSLACEWQTGTDAYLDLYGDGKMEKVSVAQNVKYAKLFNSDDKYYRIEAHDGYGFGNTDTTYVGLRVYEGNSNKLLFDKRFKKNVYMQRPHITVADMDNDGEQDIIITSWEGVYVFNNKGDSIAGLGQDASGWHHLRKRGFAAISDVDGNGYKDVIIIGAYPYHVDVIKNDGGVLKFGWTKIFDAHIESAKKISRPILNSVSDFDGDGTVEILINVYNYNGQGNWAGILFDSTNGAIKGQIRDGFVFSATDLNNDGKYVFFCTETQSQSVPVFGLLKAITFENGEFRELLRISNGEWITQRIANVSPTVTTHADGISNLAEDAVLCVDYEKTGRKVFFAKVRNSDGSSSITGYQLSADGKADRTTLGINIPEGMHGEILRSRTSIDGRHHLLLRIKAFGTPGGTVAVSGAMARHLGRFITRNSKDYIPVIADINADGHNEIIIPNDVGEVICFSPNRKGEMEISWKVPGHGMRFQYTPLIDYGIAVDDLNHDGLKEVIVSGGSKTGAVLSVFDHEGELLWKKSFPEISARDVTTYEGNIVFFGTVQSSERIHRDVIVTVQRVIQHTGKTYCLNGTDGSIVWKLTGLTANRGPGQAPMVGGAGGNIFSTYDIDRDGSEEVMCGYGNILFFADSNDGAIQFKSFMRKLFMDKFDYQANGYKTFWVDQMLPVAFGDAGAIRLSSFNSLSPGTLNSEGNLLWYSESLPYSNKLWQCLANLDGDGKLWVVELSTRSSDGRQMLFAYDPVNGAPHKSFSIEMTGSMPVACDMNGDGRDELVVSNSTGIYCVGVSGGEVGVLWKFLAPDCGPAVVADADSDGFVEVVTATQKGEILIVDGQ